MAKKTCNESEEVSQLSLRSALPRRPLSTPAAPLNGRLTVPKMAGIAPASHTPAQMQ